MKRLYIFLLLLLLPTVLLAQYNVDGRRIWPNTIDSTKFTKDRSALLGPGIVGGSQMVDATFGEKWIPVDFDSIMMDGGVSDTRVIGTNGWAFPDYTTNHVITGWFPDATSNPYNMIRVKSLGFEADGSGTNDSAFVYFTCPANYKDDTMELYLYYFHLDADGSYADSIVWDGTVQVTGGTDSTVSFLSTAGTAMTSVATRLTRTGLGANTSPDSLLFICNLDPEVVDMDSYDLIRICLWADVTRCDLDSGEEVYLLGVLVRWDIAEIP